LSAFEEDLVTQHIVECGAHTRVELAFLLSVTDTGDRVFDLGSHIGSFALPLAKRVGPPGRVLAVEAHPETFGLLCRNIVDNGHDGTVIAINRLIAPPGSYIIRETAGNTGAARYLSATDQECGIDVATAAVDSLCHEYFFPRVVKVDLEGFEAYALATAHDLLERRPILYLEVCPDLLRRAGSSLEDLSETLESRSYRFFKNIGDRNAPHDHYVVAELSRLGDGGEFCDVLAIHEGDPRLRRVTAMADR
jgi:FkbM family methyltransferase